MSGLDTVVVIVVLMRFVWSVVADMLDTPEWADPRKNGSNQRFRERNLAAQDPHLSKRDREGLQNLQRALSRR